MNKKTIEEIKRIWKWERGVNPEYYTRVLLNDTETKETTFETISIRVITLEMIVTLTKITYKDEEIYISKMINDDIDKKSIPILSRTYEGVLDREIFGDTTMLERTEEWIKEDDKIDEEEREARLELLEDMKYNKGIYRGTIKLYKKINSFKKELKETIEIKKLYIGDDDEILNKLEEMSNL